MPQSIRDWVITVGMDTSEADTKIRALEKRIGRSMKAAYKSQAGSIGVVNRALRVQVELLRRRNALEGRKTAVQSIAPRGGLAGGVGSRARTIRPTDTYTTGRDIGRKVSRAEEAISGVGSQASAEALRLKASLIGTSAALTEVKKKLNSVGADKAKFRKLKEEVDRLTDSLNRDAKALNRVTKATHRQSFAANSASHSVKNLARSWLSVFAALAGARSFYNTGKDLQSLQGVLLASTGSSEAAAETFKFINEESLRLGTSLQASAHSFAKFGAAARGSGLALEEVKELFTGISEVNMSFQLSSDSSKLAFLAFEQMLSKGTVSMEELRRQLGERWPGAFTKAAESMGITTKAMNDLVSSGKLMSKEFVGGFIKTMVASVKESGAYTAALKKVSTEQGRFVNRLQNAINAGFMSNQETFAQMWRDLAVVLDEAAPLFKVFGAVFSKVLGGLAFVLKVLSPLFGVFTNSVDSVFDAFSRAGDIDIATDKLSALEYVLRVLDVLLSGIAYGFLWASDKIQDFASWLGVSEDATSSMGRQLVQIATMLLMFKGGLWLLKAPLKMLRGMFSGIAKLVEKIFGQKGVDALNKVVKTAKKVVGISATKPSVASAAASGVASAAKDVAGASAAKSGGVMSKLFAPIAKVLEPLSKFVKAAPLITAGIAGIDVLKAKEGEKGKEVAGFAGTLAGLKLGTMGGAALGTAIAPGVGTAIGGLLGAIAGAIGGESLFEGAYSLFGTQDDGIKPPAQTPPPTAKETALGGIPPSPHESGLSFSEQAMREGARDKWRDEQREKRRTMGMEAPTGAGEGQSRGFVNKSNYDLTFNLKEVVDVGKASELTDAVVDRIKGAGGSELNRAITAANVGNI